MRQNLNPRKFRRLSGKYRRYHNNPTSTGIKGLDALKRCIPRDGHVLVTKVAIPLLQEYGVEVLEFHLADEDDPWSVKYFVLRHEDLHFEVGLRDMGNIPALRAFLEQIDKVHKIIQQYLYAGYTDIFYDNIHRRVKSEFGKSKGRALAFRAVCDGLRAAGVNVHS
jgi:hypothetical protein